MNFFVGALGIILVLIGIIVQTCAEPGEASSIASMLLYSVGASVFSSSIVTTMNYQYLVDTREINKILAEWRLYDLYETKAIMNERDADNALISCKKTIDIIAEGMSNYIAVQGSNLINALDRNVKIRIISCDSEQMLAVRAKDESLYGQGDGKNSVQHVKDLVKWIDRVKSENPSRNIEIRFHSSYPGLSYLKLDSIIFIGVNLWKRQSQQSFALSFIDNGKGSEYFQNYFESLWSGDFVHKECQL